MTTTLQTAGEAMEAIDRTKETIARMGVEIKRKKALLKQALAAFDAAKRWHQGDKWRNSNKHGEWEAQMDLLNMAIDAITKETP